jgi:predicted ATP-dependent endonuclease of OLD family
MQLEGIQIENLFGRFNYSIPLRRPEKITIIHAPNGFGKTVLLTLVSAFFSRQFITFFKYQFKTLVLQFDNRESVEIRKEQAPNLFPEKATEPEEVQIVLISPSIKTEPFKINSGESFPRLNRFLSFIEPAGLDTWIDENVDEVISTREVITRYSRHLPADVIKIVELPPWLREIAESSECRLIETQRLLRIEKSDEVRRITRRTPGYTRSVVEVEARDLANRIAATLADYANQSQSLDQSFPRRVIDAFGSGEAPLPDDATRRLRDVEQKRLSLIEAGLLDKSGAPEILTQAELEAQQVRQVIGVYLDDMEDKFSEFDELFQRVSLFKEIISEKFQFKNVIISREKGLSAMAENGREISLTDLSSGEQHELVLQYELLFGVRDNALILIDEPELSLHVGWQIRFLPDLQRIQKLRPMQIIMATHSPQIINDRWDLTVELKS